MSDLVKPRRRQRLRKRQPIQRWRIPLFIVLILIIFTVFTLRESEQDFDSPALSLLSHNNDLRSSHGNRKSRRRFVSYHSSPWEKDWLEHVDEWSRSRQQMCDVILSRDLPRIRRFLNLSCTSWFLPPYEHWCTQNDAVMPMYYNTKNETHIEWQYQKPFGRHGKIARPTPPVRPEVSDDILSKFVFSDDTTGELYTEYIEPLVAGLRHPLANCHTGNAANRLPPIVHRGYILPPPCPPRSNRNWYFDAGASSWSEGDGGPSISYFVTIWQRQGIHFDRIQAYEVQTSPKDFYATVPDEFQNMTIFRQCAVASSVETEDVHHPFLPHEIQTLVTDPDDYVVLKLDIDSALVEDGSIRYLLQQPQIIVDEVAWEHHVEGNPIMRDIWKKSDMANLTLRESYDLFLQMRQRGIRAHSWV